MKKIMNLLLLLTAMAFTACSSDDGDGAFNVSFTQPNYSLTDGSVTVNIVANNAPAEATEIPVTFGGTAVKDQDYTVSSTKYVVGGTSQVLSITVTAKNNFAEDKTITMSLSGVATGSNPTTTIALNKRARMLYTFSQKVYLLGSGETDVELSLLNATTGEAYNAANDMNVSVYADMTSTAVEGEDYEFVNKTATIKKGTNKCVFKLKAKKTEPEEDKNTIVLMPQLNEADGFVKGEIPVANVTLIGSYLNDLFGTWQMNELIDTKEAYQQAWGFTDKDVEGYPTFNAEDEFTFSADGTLTTSLKSEFKNYFQAKSNFVMDKELQTRFSFLGGKITLQMIRLDNVNRDFSANSKSADKEALLGLRNIKNDKGETLLDVYIIDYKSTSFGLPSADYMYGTEKPVANTGGVAINFTLKKKQ